MAAPRVICCPPELRADALRGLHEGLPTEQQAGLLYALDRIDVADGGAWDGLLIVQPGETPESAGPGGVTWIQQVAGNTAVVWPPNPLGSASEALLRAAAEFAEQRGIPLVQLVVSERDAYDGAMLQRAGFRRLAEFLYLFAEPTPAAERVGDACGPVKFVGGAGAEPARLAALVEQTYAGTRDCPAMDGVRNMADVLDGYRAQGTHLPQRWYFVEDDQGDVGALILADHPAVGNWELVYMGVIPEARGRRIGEFIVRFALDEAARGGAERLVLAVDAANAPALDAYRRLGFAEWDRRIVYARLHRER